MEPEKQEEARIVPPAPVEEVRAAQMRNRKVGLVLAGVAAAVFVITFVLVLVIHYSGAGHAPSIR